MNKYLQQDLDEKIKERDKRFTKFITFLVLWLLSGIIFLIIWFLSALTLGLVGVLFGWILGLGASITFLVLWIYNLIKWISLKNECQELERQSRNYSSESEFFFCGICNIKYKEEFFLGGETAHEGKICRSCLGKRQRGESISPTQTSQSQTPIQNQIDSAYEPKYRYQDNDKNKGEKRILARELRRKQGKRNGYLTQFIVNLAVTQWLLPLITYLIYWIQLKEKMKIQALNHPHPEAGLATEIPFGKVIKDFFWIRAFLITPLE